MEAIDSPRARARETRSGSPSASVISRAVRRAPSVLLARSISPAAWAGVHRRASTQPVETTRAAPAADAGTVHHNGEPVASRRAATPSVAAPMAMVTARPAVETQAWRVCSDTAARATRDTEGTRAERIGGTCMMVLARAAAGSEGSGYALGE